MLGRMEGEWRQMMDEARNVMKATREMEDKLKK